MANYNDVILNRVFTSDETSSTLLDSVFVRQYVLNARYPLHRGVNDNVMTYKEDERGWLLFQKTMTLSPFNNEREVVEKFGDLLVNNINQQKFRTIESTCASPISNIEEAYIPEDFIVFTSSPLKQALSDLSIPNTIVDIASFLYIEDITQSEFNNKIFAIKPDSILGTLQVNRIVEEPKLYPIISLKRDVFGNLEVSLQLEFSIHIETPSFALCLQLQ